MMRRAEYCVDSSVSRSIDLLDCCSDMNMSVDVHGQHSAAGQGVMVVFKASDYGAAQSQLKSDLHQGNHA